MAEGIPKHGEFCWVEIATDSLKECENFYSNVFNWEIKDSKNGGEEMEYKEFNLPEEPPMGGMFNMIPEIYGGEIPPPHLMNYVAVDNVDETCSKVSELGGTVLSPAMDIPNVGRFAVIQDPSGAAVSVITLAGGES